MRTALHSRLLSIRYEFAGFRTLVSTQPNFRLHLIAAILVIIVGVALGVTRTDWLWLAVAVFAVWLSEAFNTALEFLADAVTTERHPLIGKAKDCAAAAVLISAAGAVVVGLLVLGPRLLGLLG